MTSLIYAEPHQFIALCGYAGAGKDVFAQALLDVGYVRHNYGDIIKEFFDEFTSGVLGPMAMVDKIRAFMTPDKTERDLYEFMVGYMLPYYEAGHRISAFTEDRSVKPHVRGILEHGGELIYQHVQRQYNSRLSKYLLEGKNVVNTRLCLLPEARSSLEFGHTVYLIERENWLPASDWDARIITDLELGGFIHHTIYNDSPDAEGWERKSREYVQHNILPLRGLHNHAA